MRPDRHGIQRILSSGQTIPLALLDVDETRQMGIGYLHNFVGLVLGYAALSFALNLFPTPPQMAVSTSW